MADIVRPLGDVFPPFDEGEGVGVVDSSDLQAYVDANNNNNARTIITFDTTTSKKVLNDVTNGGFVGNQAKVASVHETGFVSDLDRVLMKQYLEASPKPNTIREFINQLDTAEIIPPVDPSVDTLEELREDVTTHILDLKVHQADKERVEARDFLFAQLHRASYDMRTSLYLRHQHHVFGIRCRLSHQGRIRHGRDHKEPHAFIGTYRILVLYPGLFRTGRNTA